MTEIRTLCVFCGSSMGRDAAHRTAAAALGRTLSENDVGLVYGGGRVGLMGVLADAAIERGGRVVGVIPRFLIDREVEHVGVTELVEVDTMHERKFEMFARSDAFAVFPGGIGTLDEAFEILSWKLLRLHEKPVVLVNNAGYWRALLGLIDTMVDEAFARSDARALFELVDGVDDVLPTLRRVAKARAEARPSLF